MNHVIVKLLQGDKHVRSKRIPQVWVVKTVIAQQARINALEQALAESKALVVSLTPKVELAPAEVAPSALPELLSRVTPENVHPEVC
jgi:hypothetical protein